jgi:hypothetical protein
MSDPETIAISLTFKQAQRVETRPRRRRFIVTDVPKSSVNSSSNDASPPQAPSPPPLSYHTSVYEDEEPDHFNASNVTAQGGLTGRLTPSQGILSTRPPGQSGNVKHVDVSSEPAVSDSDIEGDATTDGHVRNIYNAVTIMKLINV